MQVVPAAMARLVQGALNGLAAVDRLRGNSVLRAIDPHPTESPYERLEALRSVGPVLRSYGMNGWFVMNHADVVALLRDERLSSAVMDSNFVRKVIRTMAGGLPVPALDNPSMLLSDPPDHTRLRRLAAAGFTNRYVQSLAPQIDQLVETLLNAFPAGQADLVKDLARPLPAIVIAEMLGVPVAERALFEHWSAELVKMFEIGDHRQVRRGVEADLAMRDYLRQLVAAKRNDPGEDLLTRWIEAETQGDRLGSEELYAMCVLLLVAGHETTTRLIGNCLSRLLQEPSLLAEVRADRSLVPAAIDETLRCEPPTLLLTRSVAEDFDLHGKRLRTGQLVILSLAGANRDPAVHERPGDFDVHRSSNSHLTFGHGIHQCIGMPLARLEARIAVTAVLERFQTLESLEPPRWEATPFFRGLEALPVRLQ